jgi:hypothetical protein
MLGFHFLRIQRVRQDFPTIFADFIGSLFQPVEIVYYFSAVGKIKFLSFIYLTEKMLFVFFYYAK